MKRFLTLTLFLSIALCAAAQSRAERILAEIRNPKSDYVVVIAHRSDWRHHPENSLAAIQGAINMGVDMVEIDVQRTADGVIVCCHDSTVDRTTNGKGKVSELTSDYIATLNLKTKQGVTKHRMPTLAEALDLCRDRVLINIDKGYNYYDQILEMLEQRNMVEQVVIKGSIVPKKVAQQFAKHQHNMLYMPIINYMARKWDSHSILFEEYLASDIPSIAYEICWDGTLRGEQKIFNKVIASGAKLWVNTLWNSICGGDKRGFKDDYALGGNEDKIYGTLLKRGVTMIQTDRPQLLLDYLNSIGRHTLD